ncbi:hypothetical protein [Methylocapsa aurea]|jgi:hypothetical protein|uniref:hypothetical protein n=1 Tax=Methylocapsa aurea TaxID=663610 RepID=UPI003D188992
MRFLPEDVASFLDHHAAEQIAMASRSSAVSRPCRAVGLEAEACRSAWLRPGV